MNSSPTPDFGMILGTGRERAGCNRMGWDGMGMEWDWKVGTREERWARASFRREKGQMDGGMEEGGEGKGVLLSGLGH